MCGDGGSYLSPDHWGYNNYSYLGYNSGVAGTYQVGEGGKDGGSTLVGRWTGNTLEGLQTDSTSVGLWPGPPGLRADLPGLGHRTAIFR